MSRNFELLQQLSKEQEVFDTGTELSSLSSLPEAPPPEPAPLLQRDDEMLLGLSPTALDMDEKQRDEIIKFVQHVFLVPGAEAPRTVVLSGTEVGNGCSWICCRAAEILATQVRGPICVVDANFRSPGLHRNFGVENHHGLSDALGNPESIRDFVRPLNQKNLWLLSCGANPANSAGLLLSYYVRLRLGELRQYFEYVLVDAPAMSCGSEGIVLSRAADGVVLVLKANASRHEGARRAIQDLHNAGAKVLGAVLNQRTFPIPQMIYNKL